MARKRSLKPSFNDDDDIVRLSDSARLLYALLWGHQDRNGVMEESLHSIRSKIYPREERAISEIEKLLEELTRPGKSGKPRLYRFTWGDVPYLYCPTMPKHQKIYADEPALMRISKEQLEAIVTGYRASDTVPQLGTVTEGGLRQSSGSPVAVHLPATLRAFSSPSSSASALSSAQGDAQCAGDNSGGACGKPADWEPPVVTPEEIRERDRRRRELEKAQGWRSQRGVDG